MSGSPGERGKSMRMLSHAPPNDSNASIPFLPCHSSLLIVLADEHGFHLRIALEHFGEHGFPTRRPGHRANGRFAKTPRFRPKQPDTHRFHRDSPRDASASPRRQSDSLRSARETERFTIRMSNLYARQRHRAKSCTHRIIASPNRAGSAALRAFARGYRA